MQKPVAELQGGGLFDFLDRMTRRTPSKSNRRKRNRNSSAGAPAAPSVETKPVEWLTVAWSLSGLLTLITSACGTLGLMLMPLPEPDEPSQAWLALSMAVLTGSSAGTLLLCLTPIVQRLRIEKAPLSLVWIAMVTGVYSWILLALLVFRTGGI